MVFIYYLKNIGIKKKIHHVLYISYAQNHDIYDNFSSWSRNHGIHNIL